MMQATAGISAVRLLLFLEGSAFALASVIHSGRVLQSYAHLQARNAEAVIAVVWEFLQFSLEWAPARRRT
jgi:hypothetical protein